MKINAITDSCNADVEFRATPKLQFIELNAFTRQRLLDELFEDWVCQEGAAGAFEQKVTVSLERLFLQSVYQSRSYPQGV